MGWLGDLFGGVGSLLTYKQNRDNAKRQRQLERGTAIEHNTWLDKHASEIQGILDKLGMHGIDPFGQQTATSTTSGTQSFNEDETPTMSAEYQPLAGLQRALLEKRLSSPTGLPAGYAETGVESINQANEGAINNVRNLARQRGVSADSMLIGSPAEQSRRSQIASFTAGLPLQARELQNQDVGLAQSILQAFGRGTKRRGSTSTNSTTTQTGGPDLGGLVDIFTTPGPRAPVLPV